MFLILPTVDAIKGAMMTNALCLVPGVLLLFTKNSHKSRMYWMVTLGATVCQLTGLVLWPLVVYDESNKFWYLPVALLLVSFSWWENFIDPSSENRFIKRLWIARQDLAKSRYFTYIIISIWKIAVIFSLMVTIEYINDGTKAVESTFKNFSSGFRNHEIEIVRDKRNLEYQATIEGETHKMTVGDPMIPLWVLLIHCSATYLCYAVAKFSCKICIQGISFAIPVNLAVPVTVSFLWAVISASAQDKCEVCKMFKGFQYIFWYTQETDVFTYNVNAYNYISTFMWIISLASQIWISIHVWFSTSERLASTEKLFITPMYSSVIIDQSLAMNRRRLNLTDDVIKKDVETVSINVEHVDQEMNDNNNTNHYYESVSETLPTSPLPIGHNPDETVTIFVCATMWHENKEEMIQMLKAVMRLDADQCARRHAREHFGVVQDYYDIEGFI
jgi:chitin synthase